MLPDHRLPPQRNRQLPNPIPRHTIGHLIQQLPNAIRTECVQWWNMGGQTGDVDATAVGDDEGGGVVRPGEGRR